MANNRPLPSLDEADSGDFWRGTQSKQFNFQRCSNCQTVIWYPRSHCTGCLSDKLEWETSKGEGAIYSYSVVRQSYHPFFRNLVPYAVAYVDLDEGVRLLTNVIGVDDPTVDLSVGQRVTLVWEEHEELNLPLFKPLD